MATFSQIKERVVTKYKSLGSQKEKVEFLYEVQERLRIKHNEKGLLFTDGEITKGEWLDFKNKWNSVNQIVAERISTLRVQVFTEDYSLTVPTDEKDTLRQDVWAEKKEALKNATTYQSDIKTIWQ